LNLDGSKSFINAEIIPIEVMISDGGLRAGRPTIPLYKSQFILSGKCRKNRNLPVPVF
jgi:hypothetical protein